MNVKNKLKYKCCYGVSSITKDNRHVFMLDYDNAFYSDVYNDLLELQSLYNLSDIYIIKSTNGYNAICLDKITLNLVYNFGIHSSMIDQHFIKYGFKRGYYVLRFDNDKKIKTVLPNTSIKYEKSKPHAQFLNMFFGTKIKYDNDNFDKNSKLDLIQYPSDKNGYHNVEVLFHDKKT